MNVVNRELAEELYKLSGWGGTWTTGYPLYDLGFMLRKLPRPVNLTGGANEWLATYINDTQDINQTALTPEDAACSLAIELFQKGILKP